MNVLISTNAKAFIGAELVVYSFMQHHKNVHWYVTTLNVAINDEYGEKHVHDGISDDFAYELKKIVKYFDSNSTIEVIDTSDLFIKELAGSVNDLSPFTPFAAIRLMSDLIVPEDVHDLLYLDVDTIVRQNIEADYVKYTTIDGPYAAHIIKEACSHKGEMISSVIFFNMDICRKTNFFKKARENYKKFQYRFPDQMAIRDTADPVDIEENLNYMRPLEDAEDTIKIYHFSNKLAPKIYNIGWEQFFIRFPQFTDIKEGVELVNSLNFNIIE